MGFLGLSRIFIRKAATDRPASRRTRILFSKYLRFVLHKFLFLGSSSGHSHENPCRSHREGEPDVPQSHLIERARRFSRTVSAAERLRGGRAASATKLLTPQAKRNFRDQHPMRVVVHFSFGDAPARLGERLAPRGVKKRNEHVSPDHNFHRSAHCGLYAALRLRSLARGRAAQRRSGS